MGYGGGCRGVVGERFGEKVGIGSGLGSLNCRAEGVTASWGGRDLMVGRGSRR